MVIISSWLNYAFFFNRVFVCFCLQKAVDEEVKSFIKNSFTQFKKDTGTVVPEKVSLLPVQSVIVISTETWYSNNEI